MTEKFYSKALEANLAETRYKNIVIPDNLQQFIDLSAKYYGINRRAQECIIEYLHPYSNRLFVIEQLREILISDFWFYAGLDNPREVFGPPLTIYDDLLKSSLKEDLARLIVQTLLEFIQRLHREQKEKYYPVIESCLKVLTENLRANRMAFITSSRYFVKYLGALATHPLFALEVLTLVKEVLRQNMDFWDESTRIEDWFVDHHGRLQGDFRQVMDQSGRLWFEQLRNRLQNASTWEEVTTSIPVFDDIAAHFISLTDQLESFIDKFHYTFYLLRLPGMQQQRDRLIWNINKVLRSAIDEVPLEQLNDFTDQIFELCEELRPGHTSAVLDVILTLGKRVVDRDNTEDHQMIGHFERKLIDFGFETPGMIYVTKEWQIHVNENHIKNIRVWLELIEYSRTLMEKLLSALIVNLKLGGIFISDTDLFQREITKILNSNIAPYYKKVKQLTRIFPVYFHEIGAEGEIRNVTTNMDEINHRQDKLVHFLRKQVHTESNNTLIDLTRRVFRFWYDGNREALQPFLPEDVFESIDLQSPYFIHIHRLVNLLVETSGLTFHQLLETDTRTFESLLERLPQDNQTDLHRLECIHKLYALLKEKYSFETVDIISILRRYAFIENQDILQLQQALESEDHETALRLIYRFMEKLKKIIFNPEPSQAWENIYHKRHIAIGIPSMYGIYREPKFEAIGLTFRLENIATRLMEKIVDRVNLSYISAKTLRRILQILEFFKEGLELDGIYNQGFNSNLDMFRYALTSRSFSLKQYLNIFQFIAENVKVTIDKYFLRSYEYPLKIVIDQLFLKGKSYTEREKLQIINQKSEEFYRDIISQAFLVQPLDNLVSRILYSLHNMVDKYPPELISEVMSYNSDLAISPLYQETLNTDNQIFLGSKAFFLKKLYLAGFPVPPGFVLTTEVFRRRHAIKHHEEIGREMDEMIMHHLRSLEKLTGRQFGNPKNPLLLSVRSGTAISMPGAMDTFLNVGMNDELTEGLSKQYNYGWTSWDCYRRLLQSWGMAHGISRDVFDGIMRDFKIRHNVDLKMYFKPEIMREIAQAYRKALDDFGVYFEQDLIKQLRYTINCVFDSWDSDRARVYRKYLNIADEWGTAVIVQKMILGNLHYTSGTGVVFTQHPQRQRPGVHLYGDFTLCSQGEDIVAGLVKPLPVSESQRQYLNLEGDSLQTKLPEIYKRIHKIATQMTEELGFSPQEIEFTFESENPEDLFILQTRDQDLHTPDRINVFSTPPDKMQLVGRGIGIGGGAMNGIVAIDREDLVTLVKTHPGENLILVRPDTVPDDIGMIFECSGLLTAKGGATSHAAVTAVRLGKTCVVNCTDLVVNDALKQCTINGFTFKPGDKIAIDGHHGNIFKGHYPIESMEMVSLF